MPQTPHAHKDGPGPCARAMWLGRVALLCVAWLLAGHPAAAGAQGPAVAAVVASAGPDEPLTLGVFAYRPKHIIEERFETLGDYLTEALDGRRVRVLALGEDELQARINAGTVDFVLTHPNHYIGLRDYGRLSGALATMVLREGNTPVHSIGGVIVRRSDRTDIQTLADLKGRRISITGRQYLGTYMAPAAELLRAGVNPSSVTFVESAQPVDRVITAVLEGQTDAGFVRTGVLEELEREGTLAPGLLEVVNPLSPPAFPYRVSTRLYPEWPFLAVAHVSAGLSHRVASALMDLPASHPASRLAGIYGFTIPADYSSVENAMRELRMPPFDATPPLVWSDVWRRYQPWIVSLAVAGLLVLGLAVVLAVNTRRLVSAKTHLQTERSILQATTERLNNLMDASPVMTFTLRVHPRYTELTWFSANTESLLGFSVDDVLARKWWTTHMHPDDLHAAREKHKRLLDLGHIEQTFRFRDKQGRYHWFLEEIKLLPAREGVTEALGVWRDITEQQAREESLKLAASVFANSYDAVIVTDHRHRVREINPAFSRITGYLPNEVEGLDLYELITLSQQSLEFNDLQRAMDANGHWRGELTVPDRHGHSHHCQVSISAVQTSAGKRSHHVVVLSDISHLKRHQTELDQMAYYDALTGVPNRRLLQDRLVQAVARARRSGKALAICYLDLDDFKPINDRFGHTAGDRFLIEIAARLQQNLRTEDTLARLGGDEFVMLLNELDGTHEWEAVLQRVMQQVQAPVTLDGHVMAVSVSVGVTLFPDDDADPDALLRHADQAMYRAKQAGRNRYHLFDMAQDREVQMHREQLVRLERALVEREFVLHYQPQVDLQSGDVVGVEALIRWRHPAEGLLAPHAFLPQLAGTELEIKIGEWVIETALQDLDTWLRNGLALAENACVGINLGGNQLLLSGFRDWLLATLRNHPAGAAQRLEFEILESAAISDVASAARVMADCRKLGVRFALDDFGTGYSSLAYFRALPFDVIKIDRVFVLNMLNNPDDHNIVQSVAFLARAFGRSVVAEGVETLAHAGALLALGCQNAQGYAIARPMPAQDLPNWLAHWQANRPWETLHAEHLARSP